MSSPRSASVTAAPTARSSAATPSSCLKSGRSACSTRSPSTRPELLAAAKDAGELAVHQDAGKVRLGAGIIGRGEKEGAEVQRGGRPGCQHPIAALAGNVGEALGATGAAGKDDGFDARGDRRLGVAGIRSPIEKVGALSP